MNEEQVQQWMKKAEDGLTLDVDLEKQKITDADGTVVSFDIPAYHKEKLLNGWDDIALTLLEEDAIQAFEEKRA